MVVTKMSHIPKQTPYLAYVCVTFLLPPDIKRVKKFSWFWAIKWDVFILKVGSIQAVIGWIEFSVHLSKQAV